MRGMPAMGPARVQLLQPTSWILIVCLVRPSAPHTPKLPSGVYPKLPSSALVLTLHDRRPATIMAASRQKERLTNAFQHVQTLAKDSSYAHDISLRAQPVQPRQFRLSFLRRLGLSVLCGFRYFRGLSIFHLQFVDSFYQGLGSSRRSHRFSDLLSASHFVRVGRAVELDPSSGG